MRVGLTCTTIEPALTQGKIDGIGVYTKTLLERLTQLQHDVLPYSFRNNHQLTASHFHQGKIFPLPYTMATLTSLIKPLSTLLYQQVDKKLDLLHVTDHMVPRINKIPLIATIHDALMFTHPDWYSSKLRPVKNSLRKKTFQWINHFITISHAMVPELVEYMGIPQKKISVVYNGIADEWHHTISTEEKVQTLQKLNLPSQFILYTGTLQPKKNLPRLINAYLTLPKDIRDAYPLVIVGKAGWDVKDSLAAIQQLTQHGSGYWLNYVSDEQIRVLYQAASLYIFPSLHEGFGRTLLEAFASKTPVITSNVAALPEIAADAAHLVDPYSIEAISSAMKTVLTNTTLQQTLINKGVERVKLFTLKKCTEETIAVYQQV